MSWMNQVEPLTLFEVMHTYGFIKIMSMIWAIPILLIIGTLILKRKKMA